MRIVAKPVGNGRARLEYYLGGPLFELTSRTTENGNLISEVTVDANLARDIVRAVNMLDMIRDINRD